MQIYLTTLGCRLNEAELERWANGFQAVGCRITTDPSQADLLVINTCAVTAEAVKKSRKLLKRTHRHKPSARLVVSGCYSTLDPVGSAAIEGVDLVIPNGRKEGLVEEVMRHFDLAPSAPAELEAEESALVSRGRQRAFIKVQDGCRYHCTFCIVTLARGEEWSRPADEIVEEIEGLRRRGVQEVVLTGVHLGGYGADRQSTLHQLLATILEETHIPRIRLGALEPWDLPEAFWSLFDNPRLLPHLHLPLQSGSDEILRRMGRRCKSSEFAALVAEARRRHPHFNITTDIIVGFPGESDAHWQESLRFIQQIGFGHLHIFAFSPRSGTRAAELPDPVPRETIRERSAALHPIGRQMKRAAMAGLSGSHTEVLIEGVEEGGWVGYTANYHRIRLAAAPDLDLTGSIQRVVITGRDDAAEVLTGRLESLPVVTPPESGSHT